MRKSCSVNVLVLLHSTQREAIVRRVSRYLNISDRREKLLFLMENRDDKTFVGLHSFYYSIYWSAVDLASASPNICLHLTNQCDIKWFVSNGRVFSSMRNKRCLIFEQSVPPGSAYTKSMGLVFQVMNLRSG